ncbi:MAG: four helix bundle protein [Nitrosotalea sp.]
MQFQPRAGEYSPNEKVRFYRMARRSATECASVFDICGRIRIIDEQRYQEARELLLRIVSMLTKMAQSIGSHAVTAVGAAGASPDCYPHLS